MVNIKILTGEKATNHKIWQRYFEKNVYKVRTIWHADRVDGIMHHPEPEIIYKAIYAPKANKKAD